MFSVSSGACDRCAVMEKQIKTTNTELKDTNQKNLSVISELGEDFIIIMHYHIVTHHVYQSISINPIMCVLLSLEAERKTLKDENRRLSLELERLRKSG